MNSVDKQFAKLDEKASKLTRAIEKETKNKSRNKAVRPVFTVLLIISLLLVTASVMLLFAFVPPAADIKNISIGLLISCFLVLGFLLCVFSKNRFVPFMMLLFSVSDLVAGIYAVIDKSYIKSNILLCLLCAVMFVFGAVLSLRLMSYKRRISM